MKRRDCWRPLLGLLAWPAVAEETAAFDFARVRQACLARVAAIRQRGELPIIDIESSYNPLQIDLPAFVGAMDRAGIAQMCISVDQPGSLVRQGQTWSDHALLAHQAYPAYFIPTGNGGNHPAWTQTPDRFLDDTERAVRAHRYPLMGEFEFRHYPSPRQVQRGDLHRDVNIPIDSPQGHRLFAFSAQTGIAFQIHYEIEDALLDPLAAMLAAYPRARVIWCHLDQIRYGARASRYSPQLLADWLQKYPNLYVDTAFGDAQSVYPLSGERHAHYWRRMREWQELMVVHPYRFLAALDIGGDRMHRLEEWTRGLRTFLQTVPAQVREVVAYKAAWKLLFNEEI